MARVGLSKRSAITDMKSSLFFPGKQGGSTWEKGRGRVRKQDGSRALATFPRISIQAPPFQPADQKHLSKSVSLEFQFCPDDGEYHAWTETLNNWQHFLNCLKQTSHQRCINQQNSDWIWGFQCDPPKPNPTLCWLYLNSQKHYCHFNTSTWKSRNKVTCSSDYFSLTMHQV